MGNPLVFGNFLFGQKIMLFLTEMGGKRTFDLIQQRYHTNYMYHILFCQKMRILMMIMMHIVLMGAMLMIRVLQRRSPM